MTETDEEILERLKKDNCYPTTRVAILFAMAEARKSEQKLWKEAQEIWKNEVKVEMLKANCDPEKHGKIEYKKLTPCGCYEAEIFHRDELLKLADEVLLERLLNEDFLKSILEWSASLDPRYGTYWGHDTELGTFADFREHVVKKLKEQGVEVE